MRVRSALTTRLRRRQISPAQAAALNNGGSGQNSSFTHSSLSSARQAARRLPWTEPAISNAVVTPEPSIAIDREITHVVVNNNNEGEDGVMVEEESVVSMESLNSSEEDENDADYEDTDESSHPHSPLSQELTALMFSHANYERREVDGMGSGHAPLTPPSTAALLSQMQREAIPEVSFSTIPSQSSSSSNQMYPTKSRPSKEKVNFLSLPTEVITRVAYHLNLTEYSYLSRTCKSFHGHFQHELIHYLKNVYGLSVRTGSLVLFAYTTHLQYRAPRLLDRIFDEFFIDTMDPQSGVLSDSDSCSENDIYSDVNSVRSNPIKPRHQDPNWPMYWSVLYSLDKQPNYLPPSHQEEEFVSTPSSCCSVDDSSGSGSYLPNQNFPCYKCASTSYTGSANGPNPKIQFMEKYAARMNAKFASRNGRAKIVGAPSSHNSHIRRGQDWHLADIRQKKTYRMLIMQNIRYGEVELLKFYGRFFTSQEQLCLQQDRELSALLTRHGIRVVLAD